MNNEFKLIRISPNLKRYSHYNGCTVTLTPHSFYLNRGVFKHFNGWKYFHIGVSPSAIMVKVVQKDAPYAFHMRTNKSRRTYNCGNCSLLVKKLYSNFPGLSKRKKYVLKAKREDIKRDLIIFKFNNQIN